jgi:DNA-binding NtrC family response regulator
MPGTDLPLDNVRALHRVRVLVVSGDQRFVRVAGFLLARSGFEVEALNRADRVLGAVDRHAPHVVILDGSESLASSSRSAAAIEALHPDVRVIVVSENGANGSHSLHASPAHFPKWASMTELVGEVERTYLTLRNR